MQRNARAAAFAMLRKQRQRLIHMVLLGVCEAHLLFVSRICDLVLVCKPDHVLISYPNLVLLIFKAHFFGRLVAIFLCLAMHLDLGWKIACFIKAWPRADDRPLLLLLYIYGIVIEHLLP